MTRADLVQEVTKRAKIPHFKARLVVDTIFDTMADALKEGFRVEIRGFGSFESRQYEGYKGRNPKTGSLIQVTEKKLPFFKVGKELKEEIKNSRSKIR